MSEIDTWTALHSAMQDDGLPAAAPWVSRATLRRIATFSRPHTRTIAAFLALATLSALLPQPVQVESPRASTQP